MGIGGRAGWGGVFKPFNFVEQKGFLKSLIECVWGNGGCGRGLMVLQ